jgi:hypothetical protein
MEYPTYIAITQLIKNKTYPLDSTTKFKKKMDLMAKKYMVFNGRLYTKAKGEEESLEVLHEGNIEEVIKKVHEEGHVGINNTWYKVKLRYHASNLFDKVKEVLKVCDTCQFRKKKPARRTVYAKPISSGSCPFHMIGVDAVGPVIKSQEGNKYILVAVDYLTRWPIAQAVKEISEETTAEFLYNQVVQNYGVPNYILTDRGSNFVSTYVKTFLKKIGCRHLTTTAFRPQTNGLCERTNQTLTQAIAKLVRDHGDTKDWDKMIPSALVALRTMKNDTTGFTPGRLLYGYDLRTPSIWPAPRIDYVEGELNEEINRRIEEIDKVMLKCREDARLKSDEKKKKQKARYDLTVQERKRYEVGEQVLMKDHYKENKFSDVWIGPMTVMKVNNSGTYHLKGPNARRLEGAVNSDQLIPYSSRKSMVPDVQMKKNQEVFQSWLERRSTQV